MHGRSTWPSLSPMARPASPSVTRARRPTSSVTAAGGRTGRPAFVESAQHAALGVFALITCSFALLVYAFLTFDFSVRYVAHNTNLGTPFWYRITGVWGALEGSIILWGWMLSLY